MAGKSKAYQTLEIPLMSTVAFASDTSPMNNPTHPEIPSAPLATVEGGLLSLVVTSNNMNLTGDIIKHRNIHVSHESQLRHKEQR
ncbi:hypothetical protein ACLOJK_025236 [Asimina triloba]